MLLLLRWWWWCALVFVCLRARVYVCLSRSDARLSCTRRLRRPGDKASFMDWEDVLGTMLHEVTHNSFGEHDDKFYAQLDEVRWRCACRALPCA
jgi:hypothetical protein